jgi:hypothetical protein
MVIGWGPVFMRILTLFTLLYFPLLYFFGFRFTLT